MENKRSGRKIEPPTEEQYRSEKLNLALSYAPQIYSCVKCGWPVAKGYCCNYCGDTDPQSKD
jgi:hypothetical protein